MQTCPPAGLTFWKGIRIFAIVKKRTFLLTAVLLLAITGCTSPREQGAVPFERPDGPDALADAIERIELIPLQTLPESLVSSAADLLADGTGWILVERLQDARILRFSLDGRFLNDIGRQGNGPGEYGKIQNTQLRDNGLTVFAMPDQILQFNMAGKPLSQTTREGLRLQSVYVPEGILTYRGYGAGRPTRVDLLSEDGDKSFLESDAKLINMMPNGPVFTQVGPVTYFTDSYNPVIYAYQDGAVRPEVSFDFGKYALGERFYQFDDAFAAAEYMMSLPEGFAIIQRYLHGGDYRFVEVFLQQEMDTEACYGICRDGQWDWFSLGELGGSPFAGSLRALDGKRLYCLLDAGLLAGPGHGLDGPLKALRDKIANPEVLETVRADDNPVIAELWLK